MSESELKIALQQEGAARIRGFWQEAEVTVAAQRQELDAELTQLHSETDRRIQAESAMLRNTLLFAAQGRAQETRLYAEATLEQRLLLLARQLLPDLAGRDRSTLWQALRGELPAAAWTAIKVHPDDQELAERDFPEATIACDETLGGGLVATSADDAIRIDNSLSCRLLRAWPDLLPQLLGELRKLVDNHATADPHTTG
jgi:vacuolar-type H+-ATPase subunit E/Vma4